MATNPFRIDGVTYDLTTEQVVEKTGKTTSWVRDHAEALGGLKKAWADGHRRPATWRFPSRGLATKLKATEAQMKANRARRPVDA